MFLLICLRPKSPSSDHRRLFSLRRCLKAHQGCVPPRQKGDCSPPRSIPARCTGRGRRSVVGSALYGHGVDRAADPAGCPQGWDE